jgi:hypothetical protein
MEEEGEEEEEEEEEEEGPWPWPWKLALTGSVGRREISLVKKRRCAEDLILFVVGGWKSRGKKLLGFASPGVSEPQL